MEQEEEEEEVEKHWGKGRQPPESGGKHSFVRLRLHNLATFELYSDWDGHYCQMSRTHSRGNRRETEKALNLTETTNSATVQGGQNTNHCHCRSHKKNKEHHCTLCAKRGGV